MSAFTHILVATDFEQTSADVIDAAVAITTLLEAMHARNWHIVRGRHA